MRILADENLDSSIIRWLGISGHDIVSIAHSNPGATDLEVVTRAYLEERVIITHDTDFGEIAIRHGLKFPGLILLRLEAQSPEDVLAKFIHYWPQLNEMAVGRICVVMNQRLRFRDMRS